jgi:glycosyltransferase involved in cell wall biosynthesis
MKIFFYAPFKPLGHDHPSGDLVIGTGLATFLAEQGYQLHPASDWRARWFFWKPKQWLIALREIHRLSHAPRPWRPDLWLTYHTYYKAPDILGPRVSRQLKVPYVIFQGMYATKRRRDWRTRPGFMLNRRALLSARHVFTNRREDWVNLKRLLPETQLSYVRPGIRPRDFSFDPASRRRLRRHWGAGSRPVVMTAAMFRPDVKTKGLQWIIRTLALLRQKNRPFDLVIAGDGKTRAQLEALAHALLPGQVRFLGRVPRERMYQVYSAADLFAFPGFRESLGMVFLEAQSCGLPVVAFRNGGIPEVVRHRRTGLLAPLDSRQGLADAIGLLLDSPVLRRRMGTAGADYVRQAHDLDKNYHQVARRLTQLISVP